MERRKEELARMSDAEFLRDLVDDGTPGKFTDDGYEVMLIGDLTKARLSALADALETDEKVLAGSGDVIADLIKSMSDALAHPTFLDPEERDNVERWHAALLASEVDANRRIAEAGHHASQMEAQRDRAVALVDEQKRYIRQLQGAIISLLEDLERAEAEPEIVFVFVENDPSAMGIEIAADIMLAVESFTTAGLSKK